jgi:transcriptional regulator with XRE-family HTH domain
VNTRTLDTLTKSRGWSQSELARRVGVSRQAVSLWFKTGEATLSSKHVFRLSEALGVAAETLTRPLPGFGEDHDELRATFLWDRLYPDLDDFAIAVNSWEPCAVARLVQVSGLYVAERLLGRAVLRRFDEYQRHIHPARRKQIEGLIRWRQSQAQT